MAVLQPRGTADSGRHPPHSKLANGRWPKRECQVSDVSRIAIVSSKARAVSRPVRAHASALPANSSDGFEKQSKIQAVWSAPPYGTVVAIYRNNTSALHGSARRL